MRKAHYDRKQVLCKNSSLIGYSTNQARVGSWLTYSEDSRDIKIGRMIGRVQWCDTNGENCKGWIVALVLPQDATFLMVRWVEPSSVRSIHPNPPKELLAWFCSDEVKNAPVEALIQTCDYGTMSNNYASEIPERIRQFAAGENPASSHDVLCWCRTCVDARLKEDIGV